MEVSFKTLAKQRFRSNKLHSRSSTQKWRNKHSDVNHSSSGVSSLKEKENDELLTNGPLHRNSSNSRDSDLYFSDSEIDQDSAAASFNDLILEADLSYNQSCTRYSVWLDEIEFESPDLGDVVPESLLHLDLDLLAKSLASLSPSLLLGLPAPLLTPSPAAAGVGKLGSEALLYNDALNPIRYFPSDAKENEERAEGTEEKEGCVRGGGKGETSGGENEREEVGKIKEEVGKIREEGQLQHQRASIEQIQKSPVMPRPRPPPPSPPPPPPSSSLPLHPPTTPQSPPLSVPLYSPSLPQTFTTTSSAQLTQPATSKLHLNSSESQRNLANPIAQSTFSRLSSNTITKMTTTNATAAVSTDDDLMLDELLQSGSRSKKVSVLPSKPVLNSKPKGTAIEGITSLRSSPASTGTSASTTSGGFVQIPRRTGLQNSGAKMPSKKSNLDDDLDELLGL
mmetsp:Transcript_2166/g.3262  ORF Transcript_2166/g.3262 Transcript_2166/m.3262 type:complete len:452 (-) Transcript_2166:253-1608(-)